MSAQEIVDQILQAHNLNDQVTEVRIVRDMAYVGGARWIEAVIKLAPDAETINVSIEISK